MNNKKKIELFKKLEFKQLLADIDQSASVEDAIEKTFEIETSFDNIDFTSLKEAAIHFELDGGNYLRNNILKFSLFTGEKHIVINADDINNYVELVSWLENPNSKKSYMMLKKHM